MTCGIALDIGYEAKREWLESLKLDGWDELQLFFEKYSEEDVADTIDNEDWGYLSNPQISEFVAMQDAKALWAIWKRIADDFKVRTGLRLSVYYHNESLGFNLNEIEGLTFLVSGPLTQTTPGRAALAACNIHPVSWTVLC